MPKRLAQLLLPSASLGLRAYDVLEDTVFVGPGKLGLVASALPFPKAMAVLAWQGDHFTVRALPGEAEPLVDGQPAEGRRAGHEARVTLGSEVLQVRLEQAPAGRAAGAAAPTRAPKPAGHAAPAAPAAPAAHLPASGAQGAPAPVRRAPGSRPAAGARRVQPPRAGWNHLTWIFTTLGLLLLLLTAVGAVGDLGALKDAERVRNLRLPEPAAPAAGDTERITRELMAAEAFEREHADDLDGAIARWRELLKKFPGEAGQPLPPEVLAAAARIESLHERASERALHDLRSTLEAQRRAKRFGSALEALRAYEKRFGDTEAAAAVPTLKDELQKDAATELEILKQKVRPLLASAPRQAHALLVGGSIELPPDLAGEVAALAEQALEGMRRRGAEPLPREAPTPPPGTPSAPGSQPGSQPGAQPGAPSPEEAARTLWRTAHGHLQAGRGVEALAAYEELLARHARLPLVEQARRRVEAGRLAARALARGPAGLLSGAAEMRRGRLEAEYAFSDPKILERDFSIEKPFASDLPLDALPVEGDVVLRGTTGVFHVLVYTSDVHVEAEGTAVVAKDLGLLAVAEEERFRALLLDLANTRFRLKKGAAATVQPGHVLWFMGEGVWKDADPGEHGFIKIAERDRSTLQPGERVKLTLTRKGERLEGGLESKSDGVALEGRVRGDDGGGMGSARVGVFVHGGELRLRVLRISGVVDMAWFERYVKELVAAAGSPP
ncbi:MAG: hypothetical protein ACKOSS_04730 [Planctomycetia bacterium]